MVHVCCLPMAYQVIDRLNQLERLLVEANPLDKAGLYGFCTDPSELSGKIDKSVKSSKLPISVLWLLVGGHPGRSGGFTGSSTSTHGLGCNPSSKISSSSMGVGAQEPYMPVTE